MQAFITQELSDLSQCFLTLCQLAPQVEQVALRWIKAYEQGRKVIFCGNGGSAADSQHLAAELVGRYKLERTAMNALALTTDTSILTAVANDYGYEQIFARQLEGVGQAGDVLVGLSTSGNSKNVVLAFEKARSMGITTVAMTGESGGELAQLADHLLNVPATSANRIQEMHIALGHLLCGMTERAIHAQS